MNYLKLFSSLSLDAPFNVIVNKRDFQTAQKSQMNKNKYIDFCVILKVPCLQLTKP